MKTFDSPYDFYELAESDRKDLIGTTFRVKDKDTLYFPIQLANGEFNYGKSQGLIFVTPIMRDRREPGKGEKWFRVGAKSPDDLDCDLDFGHADCYRRQDVIEFLKNECKKTTTYRGLLKTVQARFNAGVITS